MCKKFVLLLVGMYLPLNMGLTKEELEVLGEQLHSTCVSKTGVSEDLILAVNEDKTFADDENLKCYIKCVMQEGGVMDDEGLIDPAAAREIIPEEYDSDHELLLRSCSSKKGSTTCETAWLAHKCYAQHPQYRLL
nr:odorant binding protein [Semanotus bifasciatus]